ncbi:RNA polymerase recycling motor HelD [Ligilactobacillus animalis]|uniref:RNA polymerase recycling motor HelD n=1 Tax=Ligilactobacillus animalis TaxID=1605 RepID=UPI00266BACE9|nr:RNA polymerase recycling motor HelD [Ligilactobacillus animalis]
MDNAKKAEQAHVDHVEEEITRQLTLNEQEYQKAQLETSLVEKNYGQNAKINTFEVDDQMETNAEVQQQKQLVAKNLENEKILAKQVKTLKQLKNSPYFGRIDILDPGEKTPETLYIGTASLVDEHQNFLIYDWRAPISSIYYNGTLGKVTYETPMGELETTLQKKRQFTIVEGQIKNMFDTNETVGDEMLQQVLGEHNDEYMKNIVATIQKEQNDIIRDTKHELLLVQGVAGSGKTSAILQRIAFLLYHSRDKLSADQIVLFSPNLLFSHYISEVLPSLGERNMRQVTLAEFLAQRFQGLKVETLFDRYEKQRTLTTTQKKIRAKKEEASFMEIVQKYLEHLTPAELCFSDITLDGGQVFFSKAEITEIYQGLPLKMKPAQRFHETKNILIKRLNRRIKQEAKANWVLEKIDNLDDRQYYDLLGTKTRGRFQAVDDEIDHLARKIVEQKFAIVYDALYNDYFLDIYAQYQHFLAQTLPESVAEFSERLEFHQIALEDCAPLLYLRDLLTGRGQNQGIVHLFVDEMQDYTLPQLIYLKHCFPQAKLTLLGDSEQALFNPLQTPQALLNSLKKNLKPRSSHVVSLNTSYRSTAQITDFMKALLPDGATINSFTRDGKLPQIIASPDQATGLIALNKALHQQLTTNDTVALITKDLAQAQTLYQQLHREFSPTLIGDQDRALPKGVVILPIYLAKGLEFDAVIAYDISKENYPLSDLGILYTICSRAMHELTLITIGEPSPLLRQLSPKLYTLKTELVLK